MANKKSKRIEESNVYRAEKSIISKKGDYNLEQRLNIVYDALDSTINGVIITNIHDRIEYANQAFISMFEYENKNDITGMFAADIFAAKKISKFSDIENIIDKGKGNIQEFNVYRKDGSIFPVEVATSIVKDSGGNIIGKMASFIDITERNKIEAENKKLSSEILKSQEKERQRVAKDLHDSVGQTILAAKLFFKAYQKNPQNNKDKFKAGIDFINKASEELREIYNDLYPSILKDYGLEKTIRWYAKNYLELNNIKTNISIKIKRKIPNDVEENIYRIIKELFSNITKHSQAKKVKLVFTRDENIVKLRISDNGIGFDLNTSRIHGGYGLSNIRQRVNDLGGSFIIYSDKDGTTIQIQISL